MDPVFERVPKSASVLLVKPNSPTLENTYDYSLFLFERNPETKFGGLHAYPGGKVEPQDSPENWKEAYFTYFSKFEYLEDFRLRITCLRELYEECGFLPCYWRGEYKVLTKEDIDNSEIKTDQFVRFCREKEVFPAIDRLKGWKRISPPHSIARRDDTMIYLYFIEEDEDEHIVLHEAELTSYIKGTPKELMKLYSDLEIMMVLPQPVTICWCGYFLSYSSLKLAAEKADTNILTYFEMRTEIIPVPDPSLPPKTHILATKKFNKMFNKYDSLEDTERSKICELISFDTGDQSQMSNLEVMEKITQEGQNEGLKIMIRVYPGDFAHPNETYPWAVRENYRHRVYYQGYKVFKYEVSKPIFDRAFRFEAEAKI